MKMLKGIVAFEVHVDDLRGKMKQSQSRSCAERQRAIEALGGGRPDTNEALISVCMRRERSNRRAALVSCSVERVEFGRADRGRRASRIMGALQRAGEIPNQTGSGYAERACEIGVIWIDVFENAVPDLGDPAFPSELERNQMILVRHGIQVLPAG
jgi:hypothetical protein